MNSCNRLTAAALLAAACALAQDTLAQSASDDRLKQACEALQRAPLDTAELQVLSDVSRLATNSPALRSRAMAAYSLTQLLRGNTNAFERAVQMQREAFPDERTLVRVGRDAYLAVCADCEGSGLKTALCPSCMGSGKCKTCAGSGSVKSDAGSALACPSCKQSRVCAMCAGKQKIETTCPTCKGTRLVFKLSDDVLSNYKALLTNMVALCQDNRDFADQLKQASLESDSAQRISMLQALLLRFAHRTDLAPAKDLLAAAIKKRDDLATAQLKQQEHEQDQRDLERLRELRESKDTAQALATLRAYLASHPNSPNRSELQSLTDELASRQAHRRSVKNIAYGAAALLGVWTLFQLVKPLLLNRRRAGVSTVRVIDKNQFSDPLTLTSAESKARVKTKTAEIKPDDEQTLTR